MRLESSFKSKQSVTCQCFVSGGDAEGTRPKCLTENGPERTISTIPCALFSRASHASTVAHKDLTIEFMQHLICFRDIYDLSSRNEGNDKWTNG